MLIDALRGRPAKDRLLALRDRAEVPYVCAINVEEIWRGARRDEEQAIDRFLSTLRVAPIGAAEGARAGRWRAASSSRGVTLSQADCLIAAAAVGVGASLATGNPKHFPMEELGVEHWRVDA